MAYPDYCLQVDDENSGSLALGKCDDQAKLEHTDDAFFKLIGSDDKCIGILDENDMYNNEIELNLNTCIESDNEKFYVWDKQPDIICFAENLGYQCCSDPETIVITTDEYGEWGIENNMWCGILGSENNIHNITPSIKTETYYLYNSYTNKCIHSNGVLNDNITLNDCDYSEYSLWDVPYTHDGYFHLKFNNDHCLMLADDLSLILGICGNERTKFYRNGNYIMSPLYKNMCITLDINNTLVMTDCNEFDNTQLYYFNLWNENSIELNDN
ncbi:hypothetical protein BCR36DRAFT_290666 [Piromyces finnis]|uniref:CBM10 domain-containing protein n=1 Tax=Piromyces finnis TaxID=1754191 RepID=A0A1Y1V8N1_9FUNG|nr:hypothetical protein BCR36DRAFT_290666 [Piromyces finnis]|eukprot:ORX49955.1 hypothetical protein BCR36DRAFT_290666 [Piromyces finnis]